MPRIRTIKPEIWDSPDFIDVGAAGQLAFIALITRADDEGRIQTDARHLQATCLHNYSRRTVEGALSTLEGHGMVIRYQAEGRGYVALTTWHQHQRVDRPTPSRLPAPPANSTNAREDASSPRSLARARGPDQIRSDQRDLPPAPIEKSPPAPQAGSGSKKRERRQRAAGENPRANGTNPRARGTSPAAIAADQAAAEDYGAVRITEDEAREILERDYGLERDA